MDEIINFLVKPYESYSTLQIILEVVAALFGISSVIFSARKNILVYPTGIISTAIYGNLRVFAFWMGLVWRYAHQCLLLCDEHIRLVYDFVMSIYGWYMWSKIDENSEHIPITRMTLKERGYAALIFIGAVALVLFIYHFKPYIESGFDANVLANLPPF